MISCFPQSYRLLESIIADELSHSHAQPINCIPAEAWRRNGIRDAGKREQCVCIDSHRRGTDSQTLLIVAVDQFELARFMNAGTGRYWPAAARSRFATAPTTGITAERCVIRFRHDARASYLAAAQSAHPYADVCRMRLSLSDCRPFLVKSQDDAAVSAANSMCLNMSVAGPSEQPTGGPSLLSGGLVLAANTRQLAALQQGDSVFVCRMDGRFTQTGGNSLADRNGR
jgi:hypothetical protein